MSAAAVAAPDAAPRQRFDAAAHRPSASAGGSVLAGIAVLALFFGGFGTWAALAPLSGAAVAPAYVVVDGNRRTVQHREGGIVSEILVRNGDRVEEEEVLLRLDDTAARAQVEVLSAQRDSLAALQARLLAERDGAASLVLDDTDLASRAHEPDVAPLLAAQSALLAERRRQLEGSAAVLRQRIVELQEQIGGGEAQIRGIARQRDLIADEVESLRGLLRMALVPRPRVLALDRSAAALDAERGRVQADIARARASIGEAELQILQQRQEILTGVSDGLRDAGSRLAEVEPRLRSARDTLARTVLTAPSAGEVVSLEVFTVGGVVAPGSRVLDVVPLDSPLVFQARLRPEDKNRVTADMDTEIRLMGIHDRRDPLLQGRIATVSADRLTDPQTNDGYYAVEVRVDRDQPAVAQAMQRFRLQPGMPAQVTIATEPRTALDYLMGPLRDSVSRAWREE